MKPRCEISACAAAVFATIAISGSAQAENPIPAGSYADRIEVCKFGPDDFSSMADFRARFGSAAILDVDDDGLAFGAIPAQCNILESRKTSASTVQIRTECLISGNPEDVLFAVEIKPKALSLSVLKTPRDGWFSSDFRKEYVVCEKSAQETTPNGAAATPNDAAAYYDRGQSYYTKGDIERAIVDFGQAIRLDPKYAEAYSSRGAIYNNKGDYDSAIVDLNEAIRLNPKSGFAYRKRGFAYKGNGDNVSAIADFNEAIRLNPNVKETYFSRALANLYAGALPKALADLNQARALDFTDAYVVLWLDIVARRSNVPSVISKAIDRIDKTAWPAPVVRMFLGQMTPAAVLAAADDPDAEKKRGQVCEANFYRGEYALQKGSKNDAVLLFRLAAADCPKGFVEWSAANSELKALNATL
jgi:lipoprotein NlpI